MGKELENVMDKIYNQRRPIRLNNEMRAKIN